MNQGHELGLAMGVSPRVVKYLEALAPADLYRQVPCSSNGVGESVAHDTTGTSLSIRGARHKVCAFGFPWPVCTICSALVCHAAVRQREIHSSRNLLCPPDGRALGICRNMIAFAAQLVVTTLACCHGL